MAFPSVVSGSFTVGSKTLAITTAASNDLEIGSQFGPSNLGRHYGTAGTLGGAFSATLTVSGVTIEPNGSVSNGGSVLVIFNGGSAGSIGTDYGISNGAPLLQGSVLEVLLDATGDNTLDVLYSISGGALQLDNPDPNVGVYAPNSLGLLRISAVSMPSNWTGNFNFNGATLDSFGLVPAVAGDYNQNGIVDAADYVVWRKNVGTSAVLPNDLAGGTIGTSQYNQWRANFGKIAPGAGSSTSYTADSTVPEPATLVLLMLALSGWPLRRRRAA